MSRFQRLDLVGARSWFFALSGIAIVVSLVLLAIPPSLRPGIEFTSGSTALIRFDQPVDQTALRTLYAELGHPEARVQATGENEFLIRTSELEIPEGSFTEVAPLPEEDFVPVGPQPLEPVGTLVLGAEEGASGDVTLHAASDGDVCNLGDETGSLPAGTEADVVAIHPECGSGDETVYRVVSGDSIGYVRAADTHNFAEISEPEPEPTPVPDQGEKTEIENALREQFGAFEVLEFASVSAVVSEVAVRNATIAVIVAAVFIMGYVAFAFAQVPRPFRYATCAIIALMHDVIIVLGAFSLFGKLFGTEINLMFVTGILTVIGFSVHDTIVVFDRVRENIRLSPNSPMADNVNAALLQTMARSLNTSITLLLTVLAMLLLGGVTIREFLLVILVGVVAGMYSSIGIAAQLLVAWDQGELGRWLRLGRRSEARPAA